MGITYCVLARVSSIIRTCSRATERSTIRCCSGTVWKVVPCSSGRRGITKTVHFQSGIACFQYFFVTNTASLSLPLYLLTCDDPHSSTFNYYFFVIALFVFSFGANSPAYCRSETNLDPVHSFFDLRNCLYYRPPPLSPKQEFFVVASLSS